MKNVFTEHSVSRYLLVQFNIWLCFRHNSQPHPNKLVVWTPRTLAKENKSTFLTFTYHRNTYRHAHKLAFGPYVSVHTHFLLLALTVKARYRRMMGHLFSHKPQLVARGLLLAKLLGWVLRKRRGTVSSDWFHFIFRHIPRAMKRFTNYRVIGLLGNRSLSAFVKSCEIILHKADNSFLGSGSSCNWQKQVWMGHEICIHLQQGSFLQNKCWKHYLYAKQTKADMISPWSHYGEA